MSPKLADSPTAIPVEPTTAVTNTSEPSTPTLANTPEPPTVSPTATVVNPTNTLTNTAVPPKSTKTPTPAAPKAANTLTPKPTLIDVNVQGAVQYYVSTTGSDTNPGTQSQPWKTIQKAANTVNPGDTIFVMAGTYNESVKFQRSGTSVNPIKLTNYNSQVVTINGGSSAALWPTATTTQYWIIEGLRLVSSGSFTIKYNAWGCNGSCNGIDHWTFRNNYISGAVQIYGAYTLFEGNDVDGTANNGNGGNGVEDLYDVSHHNTFSNNHIHNFSVRGLWSEHRTHDDLIVGNTINNIGGTCIDTDGFSTVEWRHIIRGNTIYNCGYAVQLENSFASVVENNHIHDITNLAIAIINYGPHIPGGSIPQKCQVGGESNQYGDTNGDNSCEADLTNNVVRQNLIYNHGSESGITLYHVGGVKIIANTIIGSSTSQWGVRLDDSAYCPQIQLQSNILSGHSSAEINLSNYASLIVDTNNLFYNSNSNNIYQTLVGSSYWNNLSLPQYQAAAGKGQGSLSGDPIFVNAANKDFHLQAVSLAIDTSVDVGLQFDLDNNPRPFGSGYDIGAYESQTLKVSQTSDPLKPTATWTNTPVAPTATNTKTAVPPTATPTKTSTPASSLKLLAPSNNGTVLTTRPTFEWGAVSGATSYTFQLSTSATFSSFSANRKVLTSTYSVTSDLLRNKKYYWRVKANGTTSSWSQVFSFTSANPPSKPSLLSPGISASLSNYAPKLDWNDPVRADHYQVQVAVSSIFSNVNIVYDTVTTSSSFIPSSPLSPNRTYYWRVRSYDSAGEYSLWSAARHFHTRLPAPLLISPDNAEINTTLLNFDWGDVKGATSYLIQVSTTSNFSTYVVNTTVQSSSYSKILLKGKKYYWRVYAKGTYSSVWSEVRNLTIQ